jgi:protein-tyrosine-phosphatase
MALPRRRVDVGIAAFALGYFLWYIPYSGLAKVLSSGKYPGVGPVSGFEMLPATALGALAGMPVFLLLTGWWRQSRRLHWLGLSIPMPGRETMAAAAFTAVAIAATTLNYTFTGISILFVLLLMRAGVLVLSPLLDALHWRRVSGYSWAALALSLTAAAVALADVKSYALTLTAVLSLTAYWGGYAGRFEVMSRYAKVAHDPALNRRFFVEEHMAATPFQVLLLAVPALIGWGTVGMELRRGFTTFLWTPAALPAFAVGLLYEGLFVFGSLIYLDRREYTFCVPVNRCASLLAGVVSAYGVAYFFGEPSPSAWQLVAAGLVVAALAVLAAPALLAKGKPAAAPERTRLLLFVCGGNTCRSPMAMAVARAELAARLRIPWRDFARSPMQADCAGVKAETGKPLTPEARVALREIGVPAPRHRAHPVTAEMIERADAVFCMTRSQREGVLALVPGAAGKTVCLDPDGDIPDPIGHGQDVYRECLAKIRGSVRLRLDELLVPA